MSLSDEDRAVVERIIMLLHDGKIAIVKSDEDLIVEARLKP